MNDVRDVGWISKRDGEWVIVQMLPGWDRLFSCWDDAHRPDFEHFHLAAKSDSDSRARSFVGMYSRSLSKCAFRIPSPNMSKYTADCVEYVQ